MSQVLQQARPGRGRAGMRPAIRGINGAVPLNPRFTTAGTRRLAGWRARNWRRAILAWFVLTLAIMAVAAEPVTAFPKAQLNSVPVARVALQTGGALIAGGVPIVLAALP